MKGTYQHYVERFAKRKGWTVKQTLHYFQTGRAPRGVKRRTKKSNPGVGKAFTYHGSFTSLILARKREREIPGSFIQEKNGRYYVLKPKKIRSQRNPASRSSVRGGILIYGKVIKIFAQKTAGPFKGQRFVHTFKPGAVMYGLPDGSLRITHP